MNTSDSADKTSSQCVSSIRQRIGRSSAPRSPAATARPPKPRTDPSIRRGQAEGRGHSLALGGGHPRALFPIPASAREPRAPRKTRSSRPLITPHSGSRPTSPAPRTSSSQERPGGRPLWAPGRGSELVGEGHHPAFVGRPVIVTCSLSRDGCRGFEGVGVRSCCWSGVFMVAGFIGNGRRFREWRVEVGALDVCTVAGSLFSFGS